MGPRSSGGRRSVLDRADAEHEEDHGQQASEADQHQHGPLDPRAVGDESDRGGDGEEADLGRDVGDGVDRPGEAGVGFDAQRQQRREQPGDEKLTQEDEDEQLQAVGEDDATRFRELGVSVANVNTGKECHLDPGLVEDALADLDLDALDTLYIENVGNMVCPSDFPLGAQARVLVVSSTEGDDVVRKHPLLFQACDAAVSNKVDIAKAVNADLDLMESDVAEIAPEMPTVRTSAEYGDGVDNLSAFLDDWGHTHTHDHEASVAGTSVAMDADVY
ncbi:hydrogenase nickel incorporation protein HypB [Halorhabdus salina]|uniref:hydrogenase nickel incorporation protein HypB n=1 Tax=Halorhabdus salina TaxID=2750670 RepID=UPI00215D8E12|nr:hydrogenase nickel incorporation protein HypB [Halorhabdus salina]